MEFKVLYEAGIFPHNGGIAYRDKLMHEFSEETQQRIIAELEAMGTEEEKKHWAKKYGTQEDSPID
tara:strand:+ start:143 stop:340 length:198 start_codon:yes stop_codon:yes gene_type:complete